MEAAENHTPVWDIGIRKPEFPSLEEDITVDVAIVGGGITGITAAHLLKEAGKKVAVLEMSRIGSGVTGGTTAHITEVLDGSYRKLLKNYGEEKGHLIADAAHSAIELIARLVHQQKINCDFRPVNGYLYTEFEDKVADIEAEIEAARTMGLKCELTGDVPLPFPVKAALKVNYQAEFHPLKYLYALAKSIPGDGSYIFENTHVEKFIEGTTGCRITCNGGAVKASKLILATHTPIGTNLPLQTRLSPYRSYVIGVHLMDMEIPVGLFWDTEDPYNYIRNHGDLLIIGGRDHKTGQEDDADGRYMELEGYTYKHFPVEDVAYRWSSQVYEPVDLIPYIGLNPGSKHIYVATGYAGNGITYGTLAARILSDIVLKESNPYIELYNPSRLKPFAAASEFLMENLNVAKHFIADRLESPEVESLKDIPAGQGKLIEINDEKVAAYRSPEGEVKLLSPECTHMGCIVQWNNAEKTWDCPCHGGRYKPTGEVIEGPPVDNLAAKKIRLRDLT